MGAPLGAGDVLEPGGHQHHGRVAIREVAYNAESFVALPQKALEDAETLYT